jgi:DNA-binding LacI/PurR family transcriptional regulator
MAVGALESIKAAGMKVPEDVSVVGFDGAVNDSFWSSRLTTVEAPLRHIGSRAVAALLKRISHDAALASQEVLPTALRILSTTAPPAN